jgi:hypothetical protein
MSKAKSVKRESKQPILTKSAKSAELKSKLGFTAKDEELLEKLEGVIAANIGAFLRLGEALCIIRDRNLQKITDPKLTFDEYCSKKWGFGKAYAYRLIGGYECVRNLEDHLAPQGVKVFPTNEAQVRPLTGLEPEAQAKAWLIVLKKAKGDNITAALVDNVVYGEAAAKPSKQYRTSVDENAVAKAGQKKLQTIAGLVAKALKVDPSKRTVNQMSRILTRIQGLLKG